MIERVSFVVLVLISIPLAYNIAHAADRFGKATAAYDGLEYRLGAVEFVEPAGPLRFTVDFVNGSASDIEVFAVEFTLAANGSSIGGGSTRERTTVPANSTVPFELEGRVNDQRVMANIVADGEVSWLVQARAQVSVDEDIDPTWQIFAFRTVTE